MNNKEAVYKKLEELKIPHDVTEHEAVYTMEDLEKAGIVHEGDFVKNLFLRDAKGKRHFLVVIENGKSANLSDLSDQLGVSKLSFASDQRLEKHLKLEKGAVSPLGIINDTECGVEVVFDQDLKGAKYIGVHPNDNTATVWLSFNDLKKVIDENGNDIEFVKI